MRGMITFHWRRAVPALALVLALLATACASARSTARTKPTVTPTAKSTPPTWTPVTNLPPGASLPQFAPSNPYIAYVCVYEYPNGTLQGSTAHLYTSDDGGRSWQLDNAAPSLGPAVAPGSWAVCSTFVDATDAQDVFLQLSIHAQVGPENNVSAQASYDVAHALYRSRDGGATWQKLTALDRTDGFTMLAVVGSRLVATPTFSTYALEQCDSNVGRSPSTILRASDDGGLRWHEIGHTIESQGYSPVSLVVAGTTLFTEATSAPQGDPRCLGPQATPTSSGPPFTLWRSVDKGDTWSLVTLPSDSIYSGVPAFTAKADGSGYYGLLAMIICIGPCQNANGASGVTTLYSTDSGATWTAPVPLNQSNIAPPKPVMFPLVVTPTGAVIVASWNNPAGGIAGPIYVWRPGATALAYYADVPPNIGTWTEVVTPQGALLWSPGSYLGGTPQYATLQVP